MKVIRWGLLGGLLGKRGDLKGIRIGIVNEKKNNLAPERGHIKRTNISGASGHRKFDERDKELERLRKLLRDLELEARGGHQRKD